MNKDNTKLISLAVQYRQEVYSYFPHGNLAKYRKIAIALLLLLFYFISWANKLNSSDDIINSSINETSNTNLSLSTFSPDDLDECGTDYLVDGFENASNFSADTVVYGISAKKTNSFSFDAQGGYSWSIANNNTSNRINYLFRDVNNLVNNPEGDFFIGVANTGDCLRSDIEIEVDNCYDISFKVALYNNGNSGAATAKLEVIDNINRNWVTKKDTVFNASTNLSNLDWIVVNQSVEVDFYSPALFFSATGIPDGGVVFFDDIRIVSCCENPEICGNGIDDDGDNLTDCADPDCAAPNNITALPTNPNNCPALDNGQIILSATGNNLEYSINGGTTYQSSNIFNGLSSNNYNIRVRNSMTGCYTDYSNNPFVITGSICSEICDNGIDDDGDNLIDCADPDCGNTNSISIDVDLPQNCPQLTDGQISIMATGDNLEYSIDNGINYQSNYIFSNLSIGNYYLTVRNTVSGCSIDYPNNPVIIDESSIPVVNDYYFSLCPGFEFESNLSLKNISKENKVYSILTAPIFGMVNLENSGLFSYTTNTPDCGNDQFTYTLCDTINNCCDQAIVYLNFRDTIKPILQNVPLDETYSCDEIIPSPPLIIAQDNCPQISIDIKETNTKGEDGCSLYDYELTRTWTAFDICGNSTFASQVIDIQDVVAPDIFRVYTLPNGSRMVAGVMEYVNNNWKVVNLPINFETQPIIFHQVVTSNDPTPVVAQVRNISSAQFELRISEEENNDNKHLREYVSWMAFEPSSQSNNYNLEVGHLNVSSDILEELSFQNIFVDKPAIFLGSQTLSEGNPFTLQQDALTNKNVFINLQEETSKDTEVNHVVEKIGYLALDNTEDLIEIDGGLIGEINTATITHNWSTVNLKHQYANPVIIVSPLKNNESSTATIRLTNINSQSFDLRIEAWEYLTATPDSEEVTYMVVEGSIPLASPEYCDFGTDSLVIGEDFIAIDNCDNNVSIAYTEESAFFGAKKVIQRKWEAIDECNNATSYTQEISCEGVSLKLKSILQGAMLTNNNDGLMRDDLRRKKLIPLKEPFSQMLYFTHLGTEGTKIDSSILLVDGANGIVDWVFVELRGQQNKEEVVATLPALIQCDGDVISTTGDTLLHFLNIPIGEYYVSIRHRNHLGLVTLNPYTFSTNQIPFVDFTYNFTPVEGSNSSIRIDNAETMWSGDLNEDGKIIYQGPGNDIFYMLLHILNDDGNQEFLPNFISQGYTNKDFNLDGTVIYQGPENDRSNLLFNTILKHPDNLNRFSNFIISINTNKNGN